MVERRHRTLKAALIARGASNNWSLRTASQTDSDTTAAQLLNGQNIALPGFVNTPPEQAASLRQKNGPNPPLARGRPFVPKQLATASHVFLCCSGLKKSLIPPYEVRVTKRAEKHVTIQLPDRQVTVSLHRVKPAFLINEEAIYGFHINTKASTDPSAAK
ncbi:hypothetical protein AAG570_014112 [Ranatra chinensis]|uniref:Transposase n=1 Tax=Ranatra chinensis TaxID=642074 RepID=A0ABD0YFW4_9HEMI